MSELKYSKEHEWLKLEGEIATVDSEACTPPLSSAFADIGITETISIARTIPVKTDLAIVTRGQG